MQSLEKTFQLLHDNPPKPFNPQATLDAKNRWELIGATVTRIENNLKTDITREERRALRQVLTDAFELCG